ncbi:Intersectin-1 [Zancudomyces culisetae]|uniref:Intersectin-1 n=1 Tax=Zancudomyces culisetae TaxID=1213189 RepID=A0A1R1PBU1_ZANCU|nr:Intersectin-1 [Zancudomyces culisetae]|eukprot:OMH78420.1 Intersectin-1 [Zancudomyces culisetae]
MCLIVVESPEPGWYYGTIEGTDIRGLFPINYVEPIDEGVRRESENERELSMQKRVSIEKSDESGAEIKTGPSVNRQTKPKPVMLVKESGNVEGVSTKVEKTKPEIDRNTKPKVGVVGRNESVLEDTEVREREETEQKKPEVDRKTKPKAIVPSKVSELAEDMGRIELKGKEPEKPEVDRTTKPKLDVVSKEASLPKETVVQETKQSPPIKPPSSRKPKISNSKSAGILQKRGSDKYVENMKVDDKNTESSRQSSPWADVKLRSTKSLTAKPIVQEVSVAVDAQDEQKVMVSTTNQANTTDDNEKPLPSQPARAKPSIPEKPSSLSSVKNSSISPKQPSSAFTRLDDKPKPSPPPPPPARTSFLNKPLLSDSDTQPAQPSSPSYNPFSISDDSAFSPPPKPPPKRISKPISRSSTNEFNNTTTTPPASKVQDHQALHHLPLDSCRRYFHLFTRLDRNKTGYLNPEQSRGVFLKSNLPESQLGQVYFLADRDADGVLNLREFILAMWLIDYYLLVGILPEFLPLDVIESAYSFAPNNY